MYFASESGWTVAEAERAFGKAVRARRDCPSRWRRLTRQGAVAEQLAIHEADALRRPATGLEVHEIPLDAIVATLEPHRAEQFDSEFRPAPHTRERWLRVWLAHERAAGLPPISLTPIDDGYAVRDGHHRISVARARGAATISAVVV